MDKDKEYKMDKGKEHRYNAWLKAVKAMADKTEITVDQAIKVINTPCQLMIRDLHSWEEASEFIGYYIWSK